MIVFEKLRFRNFLSYGNQFTEILLNGPATTLIVGGNGAGKSTMLDALTFALFNKPFRGGGNKRAIKRAQLINSVNQRDCLVEVEFSIGKKRYLVRRGIKPNIFEIFLNDKLINQDSKNRDYQKHFEDQILKMNYKSFTQVVILGSSTFTPFMQLSSADRRTIIEDLLDIQIFSVMNQLLKQRQSELRDRLRQIDSDVRVLRERAELQEEYIQKVKSSNKEDISTTKRKLKQCDAKIASYIENIGKLQKKIEATRSKISSRDKLEEQHESVKAKLTRVTHNIQNKQKQIKFFTQHDQCPTCSQSLPKQYVDEMIQTYEGKVAELENVVDKLKSRISKYGDAFEKISAIQDKIFELQELQQSQNSHLNAANHHREQLVEELENLQVRSSESVIEQEKKLQETKHELDRVARQRETLIEQRHHYDIVSVMLKDNGIKTRIISQYLPIMNQTINKYLSMLDFGVSFELDENFDETIKSRHRDHFSYTSFSEGEKQRIDLALLFTWRDIAKMRNSMHTNLLILDEVFDSSLDTGGTEAFLKLLRTLPSTIKTFIISHHGDEMYDKFKACIHFEKSGNFSRMKTVEGEV